MDTLANGPSESIMMVPMAATAVYTKHGALKYARSGNPRMVIEYSLKWPVFRKFDACHQSIRMV